MLSLLPFPQTARTKAQGKLCLGLCIMGGGVECTSDMHYKTDQGHALQRSGTLMAPQFWLYARKCVHALERESDRGSTLAVLVELPKRGDVSFGTLPRIWCFAANWLPMGQSLQRSRTRGPSGFEPQATRLLTRNVRGNGKRDTGFTK